MDKHPLTQGLVVVIGNDQVRSTQLRFDSDIFALDTGATDDIPVIGITGGTVLPAPHATTHERGGTDVISLDLLGDPTDITTNNATTGHHGLLPKLDGVATHFLTGIGTWATPAPAGAALSRVNDTNVTLTLGGTPLTALLVAASLTLGWTGQLAETRGGTAQATYAQGDMLYASAVNTLAKLTVGTSGRFITSTGAVPQWTAPGALTKTDDTNVTATLGGSATTALVNAASITLGWTGQLSIARGGTGQATAAAAFDALSPMTALGDTIYGGAAGTRTRLAGQITTTRKFLRQTGDGVNSAAPAWDTVVAADIPASALTKADDTNVTLTLGGTPGSALLAATSITAGWTGQLAETRGGTAQSSYAAGDQLYASGVNTLAKRAIGTSGKVWVSDGSTPDWSLTTGITGVGTITTGVWSGTALVAGKVPAITALDGFGSTTYNFLRDDATFTETLARATGSATITPVTLTLRSTTSANDWDIVNPWAEIRFYSDDASTPGAGVRAKLGVRWQDTAGQTPILSYWRTDATNTALYEAWAISGSAFVMYSPGAQPSVATVFANGTAALPTIVTTGTFGAFHAEGYVSASTGLHIAGSVAMLARSNWVDGVSYDTAVDILATAKNTTTRTTFGSFNSTNGSVRSVLALIGSIAAEGASAIGLRVSPTLTAAANSDTLFGARIAPTYTVGAFTGVTVRGLSIVGVLGGATNEDIFASKATGSATITPLVIKLHSTTDAANWSTTSPFAQLDFSSDDVSGVGVGVKARIGALTTNASGGPVAIVFYGGNTGAGLTESARMNDNLTWTFASTVTAASLVATGTFGVNGAAAQAAYVSGGAAGITATLGGYGFISAAQANAALALLANIRLALVANGIMS